MTSECRIQFYFRAEDVKRLLEANPGAKGVIVSQSIRKEKPKGAEDYVNVAHIRARVHMPNEAQAAKSMDGGDEPPPEEGIDGCPFPPGCTP